MPQEKISFLRKVYSIISFQLLLTIVVVFIVTIVPAVANFFNNIQDDIIGITFFASFSLCYYHENHPFDYFLLLIFTVSTSLSLGLFCALVAGALASGKIIIVEVAILTAVVVISLSLYIFWATKRGCDFKFVGPFLFRALMVLILVAFIQILFFPFGKLSAKIYGCLISIIILGLIAFIIEKLIKWFSYVEYIWMSLCLYLNVISIFLCLLLSFLVAEFIDKDKI